MTAEEASKAFRQIGMSALIRMSEKRRELILRMLQKAGVPTHVERIHAREDRNTPPPLSYAQERLWFLHQLDPDNPFYNMPAAVELDGYPNVAALGHAFAEIARRHQVLLTTFLTVDGAPVQVINPPLPFSLPRVDLTALPRAALERQSARLAAEEAGRPFDLAQGPLLRARLMACSPLRLILVFNLHHIVCDGRSIGIFSNELRILYASFSEGESSPLSKLPLQYFDYAEWQRERLDEAKIVRQVAYWKDQLAGAPAQCIVADFQSPRVRTHSASRRRITLPADLSESLRRLSRCEGVTLFMTLLACWLIVLSQDSFQEDIVVGTDVTNRGRIELESLIGLFSNQLVLRVSLKGNPTFREVLNRVQVTIIGAYANQDLPFQQLVKELKPMRDSGNSALFQVKFVLVADPGPPRQLGGCGLTYIEAQTPTTKFDLLLTVIDQASLICFLDYDTELIEVAHADRLLEEIRILSSQVTEDADTTLHSLKAVLVEADKHRMKEKEENVKEARVRLKAARPKLIKAESASMRMDQG